MEKITGRKIKVLQLDTRGEYKGNPFLKLCRDEGIERYFTVRETPQQNMVAEKMNRTLLEKVQFMSSNSILSKNIWAETLAYACNFVNRLSSFVIGGKTPLKVWYEKLLRIMIR